MSQRQRSTECPATGLGRGILLAALVLALAGCASSLSPRRTAVEEVAFYGVAGNHLVRVDPATGAATGISSSAELRDVAGMTWDPTTRTLYAIADATSDPRLIRVDPVTGTVTAIGSIDLPDLDLTLAEGLAFDTRSNTLYATGSRSKFASERLLAIDVATAEAREVGLLRGLPQNDGDALLTLQGSLLGVDVVVGSSLVYEIDPQTGRASPSGKRFPKAVTDLAFDPASRRLLATARGERMLQAMSWGQGEVVEIGPTHGASDFDGATLGSLACTCVPQGLFLDGFESGDRSAWSGDGHNGDGPHRP